MIQAPYVSGDCQDVCGVKRSADLAWVAATAVYGNIDAPKPPEAPRMNDNNGEQTISRRAVLAAAGAAAGVATGCTTMAGAEGKEMKSELEIANETLVNNFCADWAKKDIDLLADYLADDVVYQMFEGRPDIIGKAEFKKTLGGFLKSLVEVDWIMVRSYAIGPIVINERIDHFIAENEKRSMHFAIAGYFLVKDNKIQVWKDFSMPGGISQVGSEVGPA
jgi:limonene-1,2-epoxide hydrolase